MDEKETHGKTRNIKVTDLALTESDVARKTVTATFKEKRINVSQEVIAQTQKRIDMVTKLFDQIDSVNKMLYSKDRMKNMSNGDLIKLLNANLKGIAALSIAPDELQTIVQQLTLQISSLMDESDRFKGMSDDSRKRVTESVMKLLADAGAEGDNNEHKSE